MRQTLRILAGVTTIDAGGTAKVSKAGKGSPLKTGKMETDRAREAVGAGASRVILHYETGSPAIYRRSKNGEVARVPKPDALDAHYIAAFKGGK